MRATAPGMISAFDKADLDYKVAALVADAVAGTSVEVLITSAQSFNAASGITTPTTTATTVTGYLGPLDTRQAADASAYQIGDVVLRVDASGLGALDAAATFEVQPSGPLYRVISATLDPLGLHWVLVGRRST